MSGASSRWTPSRRRAVLHELDHLDGLVFLDKVSGPHALFTRRVYR